MPTLDYDLQGCSTYKAAFRATDLPVPFRPANPQPRQRITLWACQFCGKPLALGEWASVRVPVSGQVARQSHRRCYFQLHNAYFAREPKGNVRAVKIHKQKFPDFLRRQCREARWPLGLLALAIPGTAKTRPDMKPQRYY